MQKTDAVKSKPVATNTVAAVKPATVTQTAGATAAKPGTAATSTPAAAAPPPAGHGAGRAAAVSTTVTGAAGRTAAPRAGPPPSRGDMAVKFKTNLCC